MARSRRIVAIDLGSQSIGLGIFRIQASGAIELQGHIRRQVLADSTGEAMRQPQMPVVLRGMIAELRLKTENVSYSITGQSAFVRLIDLPEIENEKLQRIIAFEAEQNVPFPIDEVIWDYELIGAEVNGRAQAMVVAIKTDLLDEVNRVIEQTGLKTSIVDVAPMARYNAFRFNYDDLTGCSLLVNIGAHTTNLLFIEGKSCFSRTIPIGGGSITAAIAKEFDESFATAEVRKRRCGSLGLQNSDIEPAEAFRISKIALSIMTRLHVELVRSIHHYRTQQRGRSPDRIFLGGGGASLPGLREFFREKLRAPIEFLNPLRNVSIAPCAAGEELTRSAHIMGELVGLALRSVGGCPMCLELLPPTVEHRQEFEKRRPFLVVAAAIILFALSGWGFYYARASQVTRAAAEKIKNINAPMHAAEAKIEKLRKQVAALDTVSSSLVAAINDRFFWTQILEDLNERLPKEDIWITELIPTSLGKPVGFDTKTLMEGDPTPVPPRPPAKGLTAGPAIDGLLLRGLYLYNEKQQEVVVDYFKNLLGSPFFNVDPNNQARAIKSAIPNNADWAFPYELRLDLKRPVKMP